MSRDPKGVNLRPAEPKRGQGAAGPHGPQRLGGLPATAAGGDAADPGDSESVGLNGSGDSTPGLCRG